MSMVCEDCGRVGIRWMGPITALTHTECPHCGGINCQRVGPEGDDYDTRDDESDDNWFHDSDMESR